MINSGYFDNLVTSAKGHIRKRKMTDLTRNPEGNSMQVLLNTFTEESYSPVHKHMDYSEIFIVVEGALAFFTFNEDGSSINCYIIDNGDIDGKSNTDRAIIVEAGQYHALTSAPKALGYPGHAVVFEISGHYYDRTRVVKTMAPFAPSKNNGLNGDAAYYESTLFKTCKHR